jgi:hypothetical protein
MNTEKKQEQKQLKTAQPQLQKTRQESNPPHDHERPELRMTD